MRNRNRRRNNIIIGSLLGVVLLMVVGYAAFASNLNITGTSSISSNWDILITNITSKNAVGNAIDITPPTSDGLTATFNTRVQTPGDSITYDVTVANQGTLDAVLTNISISDSDNPAVIFTTSGMQVGDDLLAGTTAVLSVKIEYDNSITSPPENTSASLTVTLTYEQKHTEIVPPTPKAAEQLRSLAVTTGDGLYADEYEEGRYVYRGWNTNNYITFNDASWRILAVETDGTLKIMFNGIAFASVWDENNSNNWATATLNTTLNENWYNLFSSTSQSLIQSHEWAIGSVGQDETTLSDTAYLISQEKRNTWLGNIALISISDFLKANSDRTNCSTLGDTANNLNSGLCILTNYIFSMGIMDQNIWSIAAFSDASSYVWNVGGADVASATYGIMPTLYLKADIYLEGEGTSENPYTIVTD